jgi:exonuclease III
MKVATFNVNGLNGRLPVLRRWLDEAAPDIVCLQELKAPQDKFPEGPVRDAGYGAIWHGQKSWNGVAVLARGREPDPSFCARLLSLFFGSLFPLAICFQLSKRFVEPFVCHQGIPQICR